MPSMPPLQLNYVTYQAGSPWSLLLSWTPTLAPSGAYWVQMQLFDSAQLVNPVGNPVTPGAPAAPFGTWSTQAAGSPALTATTIYYIAVRAVSSSTNPATVGPWSNALPVLYLGPPTLVSATYDGVGLTAVWQPPSGTNLIGDYAVTVTDANGYTLENLAVGGQGYPAGTPAGAFFQRWELSGTPLGLGSAPLTVTLTPIFRDSATGAVSAGPPAAAGFFPLTAEVLATVYAGGTWAAGLQYTVTVQNRSYPAGTRFRATAYANGVPVQTSVLTSAAGGDGNPAVTMTLPAGLAPAELSVALAQTDGTGTGPPGAPAPLLALAPAVVGAAYANGTLTVALAYPPGAPPVPAAQATVTGTTTAQTPVSSQAAQGTITGTAGTVAFAVAAGTYYTLTVAAQSGGSLGPPSAPVNLMTLPVAIASASYDGQVVQAAWTAPAAGTAPGLAGYALAVTSGGVAVASAVVNGTSGAVAVPGGSGAPLALQVTLLGPVSAGPPPATPVALITTAPAVASAVTDAVAGTTTLSWSPVAGAAGCSVQTYLDGAPSGPPAAATGTTAPVTLVVDADQAVAVAATWTSGGAAVTGPPSPPFPLPTLQPEAVDLSFNGNAAAVRWVPAPGATGYTVTVLQTASGGGATSVLTSGTAPAGAGSAVVPTTITDTTLTYSVVVQANAGASSGPPTAAVPLFAPGLFLSTSPLSQDVPYLYPASTISLAGQAATLYLPDIGAGTALTQLPFAQGPFTLAANGDAGTSGAYPYTLQIAAGGEAWTWGTAAIRTGLQSDYGTFLQGAETRGVVPWGVQTLQAVISRALPQTFAETLYYAYGLDLARGTADLRPGMVLRVAFDGYMNVPGTPVPQWVPGYAGGASVDFDVGSYVGNAGWRVGFDAFIAQLAGAGAMVVQAPQSQQAQQTQSGAADAADLFYPAFMQPFYRLFFPSPLASPDAVGTAYTPSSFVLAAAASYTALGNTVPYPATGNAVAYFRGRAVVRLCIRVWVNGTEAVVPIGTTLGNVLDRYARRPPATSLSLAGVTLSRAAGPGVTDPSAPFDAGASVPVQLDWKTLALYDGPTALDATSLPLLHGDQL
ncbi:MAG TPA: hypothetical protein VLK84_16370, partial [Longimicrobium sp.]|nr:hypothetical protein [Longimicrobium sp.]